MTFKWKALGLFIAIVWPGGGFAGAVAELPEGPQLSGAITLQQVVAHVLVSNPELKVYSMEQRAREARVLASGLLPNPRLQVGVENITGSGRYSGVGRSETTLQLSQLIELGGKSLAARDYETKRIDVLIRASKAFIDLLRAERKKGLAGELLVLAEQSLTAVSERVRAGKVSLIEKTKAAVELSTVRLAEERAINEWLAARRKLAATWGETNPRFEKALGNLDEIATVPPLESLTREIKHNPDLARWTTEFSRWQAQIDLERSRGVPDVSLQAGVRRLEQTNDNALVIGISIPLPLFDRNQGAIAEARHRLSKAEAQKHALEINLNIKLAEAHLALSLARTEVVFLKTQMVPGAESAFEAMMEGYRFGKFNFIEVLDSQRILFQARVQYVDALANYHKAVLDVERLIGTPLDHFESPVGREEGGHEH
jgi:cobalt-zinc-cadmium efflux system outer membrane protein